MARTITDDQIASRFQIRTMSILLHRKSYILAQVTLNDFYVWGR